MGRNGISTFVFSALVVTVVDDGLCAVYEVTGTLPGILCCIISCVDKASIAHSAIVQTGQGVTRLAGWLSVAMHVLRIDETTADTSLHVDEVEFNDTSDITPFFFAKVIAGALFRSQLQIDT